MATYERKPYKIEAFHNMDAQKTIDWLKKFGFKAKPYGTYGTVCIEYKYADEYENDDYIPHGYWITYDKTEDKIESWSHSSFTESFKEIKNEEV